MVQTDEDLKVLSSNPSSPVVLNLFYLAEHCSLKINLVAHLCLERLLKQLKKSSFRKFEPKYQHSTPNIIEN